MRLFNKRSEFERLLDAAGDTVKRVASGSSRGNLVKASLIAGGVAALTAGSAAVSSLRRREREHRTDL